LRNANFDVGADTPLGQYRLNDAAHARLLREIAASGFNGTPPKLRSELLQFFDHPEAPYATKKDAKALAQVQAELQQLRDGDASPYRSHGTPAAPAAPGVTRFLPSLVN
jgi:hypothetical protein